MLLLFLLFRKRQNDRAQTQKAILQKRIEEEKAALSETLIPGEVSAAIAVALSLYLDELHDQETAILTIRKVRKTYSPWNSKIYNVINFNRFQR